MSAPIPKDEARRLAALDRYKILDTGPEPGFDDLTALAALVCDMPIALVSFVDESRQWFKSRVGIDASETPREHAFCAHAILSDDPMIVKDAKADVRFATNPLVVEDPHIRFYAGAPLRTPGGHRLGTLCVIDRRPRDLEPSKRLALQALSRQVVAQLELRRRAGTIEEIEAELRRLRAESLDVRPAASARADDDLDAMALAASRELKTPLKRIARIAQWLLEDDENVISSASEELLHLLLRRVQKMDHLVDDMLDFARAGRSVDSVEEVDTSDLVAELVAETAPLTDGAMVTVRPDLPTVHAQRSPLRDVFERLLDNAIRHHGSSQARVEVSARAVDDAVEFSVRDDGPGIAEEFRKRAFGLFETLQPASTRSGVGLAIVKKTVERLGGTVRIESVMGNGTTVTFTWPRETSLG